MGTWVSDIRPTILAGLSCSRVEACSWMAIQSAFVNMV
jgi:hypothetical protein